MHQFRAFLLVLTNFLEVRSGASGELANQDSAIFESIKFKGKASAKKLEAGDCGA